MTRLVPKLQRVENYEIEEIHLKILDKIKAGIIVNAKELVTLGSAFSRFIQNETALADFVRTAAMPIRELARNTLLTGFSLHVEQVEQNVRHKLLAGKRFTPSEDSSLRTLQSLLDQVLA